MNIYKWLWSLIGGRPWTYIFGHFFWGTSYIPGQKGD